MKNTFFMVIFLLISVLLNSCKKEQSTEPVPLSTGNLSGSVTLRNEAGFYAGNYSSVTVSVEGTSLSTQTDSSGNYLLKGIETGDRIVDFSKEGYGTFKVYPTIFHDSTIELIPVPLYVLPPFNIINLSVRIVTDGFYIIYAGITDSVNHNRGIVVYAYTDSTVSPETNKYLYTDKFYIKPNVITFSQEDYMSNLLYKGFKSGQKVYLVAYGTTPYLPYDSYFDIYKNKEVFCSLSQIPSNIVSFIIP